MNGELSPNAQAILLLTAPLLTGGRKGTAKSPITGRKARSEKPLTGREYRDFARQLLESRQEPADLLEHGALKTFEQSRTTLDLARLQRLLNRGFLLAQAIPRFSTGAVWRWSAPGR